jgi:pentapeptide MXKDX repeat protein
MKKLLIAAALTLMCGASFAQNTTGPAAQSGNNMDKPGMNDGMKKDSMDKGSMSKDGMSKDGMSKDGMSKDGMKKDDMKK